MDELTPRNIPLYAGIRTELDRRFLQLLAELPAGTNINDEIKRAYVEAKSKSNRMTRQVTDEVQVLIREIDALKKQIAQQPNDMITVNQVETSDEADQKLNAFRNIEW